MRDIDVKIEEHTKNPQWTENKKKPKYTAITDEIPIESLLLLVLRQGKSVIIPYDSQWCWFSCVFIF